MSTIAEAISRIRGQVKAEVQDSYVTDRKVCPSINEKARLC